MAANPQNLLYAKTHEWVDVREEGGQKTATIGITDFAVEALTDLVYIQLPEVGRELKAGESFGEVESVKAVSDLYSPVHGKVTEVNDSLADNLETLSEDAFGNGWMIRVEITDESGLGELMDRAAYEKQIEEES